MAYSKCPAGCGKKFVTADQAEAHADSAHNDWKTPRARGWATPHGFVDFSKPVTYAEACATAEKIAESMKGRI